MLVCTCRRWDRVTSKLIAAIHDSGRLGDAELDELADAFLAHDHVISYPLTWASQQWLEIDLHDGTGRTYTVTEDTPAQHRVRLEPPLRRWAARQTAPPRARTGSRTCSPPPSGSSRATLTPRSTAYSTPPACSTNPPSEHWSTAGSVRRRGAYGSPRSHRSGNGDRLPASALRPWSRRDELAATETQHQGARRHDRRCNRRRLQRRGARSPACSRCSRSTSSFRSTPRCSG